jgi:hypothetical protein
MSVSNRLRFEILRRDGFSCRYCGARAGEGAVLEIDHVLPKVLGGSDKPTNLVAACVDCNGGKTSTHPDSPGIENVDADAIRWWKAVRRAGEKLLADEAARKEAHRQFEAAWDQWKYDHDGERCTVPKSESWRQVLDELLTAGMTIPLLSESIERAMVKTGVQHDARFDHMHRLARAKAVEIQRLAKKIGAGEEAEEHDPDGGRRELALELLEYVPDEERQAAFDRALEDYDEDDVPEIVVESIFSTLLEQREELTMAVDRLCLRFSAKEIADAKRSAIDDLSWMGAVSEMAAKAHSTHFLAAMEATSYMKALPRAESEEWIDYVVAWPECPTGPDALVIRAADVARRSKNGEPSALRGMCQAPAEDSLINRCHHLATHSIRIEECRGCTEKGIEPCDGHHLVCEAHLGGLQRGEVVGPTTGQPIKVADSTCLATTD